MEVEAVSVENSFKIYVSERKERERIDNSKQV